VAGYLRCWSGKPVEKRFPSCNVVVLACYAEKYNVECPKKKNKYCFGSDCILDSSSPCDTCVTVKDCEVYV